MLALQPRPSSQGYFLLCQLSGYVKTDRLARSHGPPSLTPSQGTGPPLSRDGNSVFRALPGGRQRRNCALQFENFVASAYPEIHRRWNILFCSSGHLLCVHLRWECPWPNQGQADARNNSSLPRGWIWRQEGQAFGFSV